MDWNRCPPEDARALLSLCLAPGLGPLAARALLDHAGSAAGALALSRAEVAQVAGAAAAAAFSRGAGARLVEATLRWLDRDNRHLVAYGDPLYPLPLAQVHAPPPLIYVEGRLELLAARAVAIVGSRNATAQGVRDAGLFARAIAQQGIAIVSGLAVGIDAAAHRGGLAEAGSSIAIMGTGPDIRYPRGNAELAEALAERGCLVSEFALGTPPLPGNFPRRNRLISGMSKGVLVVEAGLPSGTLTTACIALEQGREVFAMPGSIHSPLAKGCHWLIKQGAKLVEGVDDVLGELGWNAPALMPPELPAGEREPDAILEALGFAPASVEQLASRTGLDAARVAARVSMLEIEGAIVPLPGGNFQRVSAP